MPIFVALTRPIGLKLVHCYAVVAVPGATASTRTQAVAATTTRSTFLSDLPHVTTQVIEAKMPDSSLFTVEVVAFVRVKPEIKLVVSRLHRQRFEIRPC